MPNWCSNGITISGEEAQLAQLAELLKADEATIMERLVPTPEEVMANSGWYQWCLENWGTKWDMCELSADYEEGFIELAYETAWSPNIPFWETISARFPELSMVHHYKEEGMCIVGVAKYKGGNCDDQSINY
jgi:hypothetical protein